MFWLSQPTSKSIEIHFQRSCQCQSHLFSQIWCAYDAAYMHICCLFLTVSWSRSLTNNFLKHFWIPQFRYISRISFQFLIGIHFSFNWSFFPFVDSIFLFPIFEWIFFPFFFYSVIFFSIIFYSFTISLTVYYRISYDIFLLRIFSIHVEVDLNRGQFGYVGLQINLEVQFYITISGPTSPAELPQSQLLQEKQFCLFSTMKIQNHLRSKNTMIKGVVKNRAQPQPQRKRICFTKLRFHHQTSQTRVSLYPNQAELPSQDQA